MAWSDLKDNECPTKSDILSSPILGFKTFNERIEDLKTYKLCDITTPMVLISIQCFGINPNGKGYNSQSLNLSYSDIFYKNSSTTYKERTVFTFDGYASGSAGIVGIIYYNMTSLSIQFRVGNLNWTPWFTGYYLNLYN